MSHLLTWHFGSLDQARNVQDDLRGLGLPIENYHLEPDRGQLRIIVAEPSLPGIVEILQRHGLTEVPN